MSEIEGIESFDALQVAEAAANGERVLVILLDGSEASASWQKILVDEMVEPCLEKFETFVLFEKTDPEEAQDVMHRWEVDQLPALVVVAVDGSALNETCLTKDSVDAPEDLVQWLDEQASFLAEPETDEDPDED